MQSITEGENTIDYAYNGDGQRVSKTVNGTKTEYYYNGSILAGQKSGEDTLVFMYDHNSDIFGFAYNGTEYYYIKNAQNDVIAIADAGGNIIANYYYDAWGKLVETTGNTEIAELNPIRYRSYYYDSETGWYYLNTRYYSPDMCRFINSDDDDLIDGGNDSLLENNLFAYCFNNSVNMADDDGCWPRWATNLVKVGIGVLAIGIGVAATVASGGAAAPVLIASIKIAAKSAAIGAAIGAGTGAISHRISTNSWNGAGKAALDSAIDGAADGFMWGGISAGATFTTVAVKGIKIEKIGKLKPTNKPGKGYKGVRFKNKRGGLKSLEIHSPHKGGPHQKWHWQLNTWNPKTGGITARSKHWTLFWRRF